MGNGIMNILDTIKRRWKVILIALLMTITVFTAMPILNNPPIPFDPPASGIYDIGFTGTGDSGTLNLYSSGNGLFACAKANVTNGNGFVNNITVILDGWDNGDSVKCMIYNSTYHLIPNGETETRTDGSGGTSVSVTFDFDTEPYIYNNSIYYIGAIADGSDSACKIQFDPTDESGDVGGRYYEVMSFDTPESPIGSWDSTGTTVSTCAYATYTAGDYEGPDFYVNGTSGDDSNPGTLSLPFATIQKAVNVSEAGDTINIMAGTYIEQVDLVNNGTSSNPITIQPYSTDSVTVNGSGMEYWEYKGIFTGDNKSHIRITDLEIEDSPCFGVYIVNSDSHNITIDNCTIHDCGNSSIYIRRNGAPNIFDVIIENNTCYNICGYPSGSSGSVQEGISLSGVDDFLIQHNYVYQCGRECIDMKAGTSNGTCQLNTVNCTNSNPSTNKIGIYVDSQSSLTCSNITIDRNLVYGNKTGIALACEGTSGLVEDILIQNNIVNVTDGKAFSIINYADPTYEDITIINNVFYSQNENAFFSNEDGSEFTNFVIRNNILAVSNKYYVLKMEYFDLDECILDNNSFYDFGDTLHTEFQDGDNQYGDDAVTTDPQFASLSSGQFWLNSTSPCIDNGSSVLAPSYDYNGTSRPVGTYDDIGAFETTSGEDLDMSGTFGFSDDSNEFGGSNLINRYYCCKGTPEYSGEVSNITIKMYSWGSGFYVKCAIYDSGLNLLGETEAKDDGGSGWETFNFASPVSVTADQLYYIGAIADDGVTIWYSLDDEAFGNGGQYREDMTYASMEDPIGSFDSIQTSLSLIAYASYSYSNETVNWTTSNETFGFDDDSNEIDCTSIKDYFIACRGVTTYNGNVTNITAKMSAWPSTHKVKAALYNQGGTLLGTTEERTSGGSGWETFNFSTNISVTASSIYYIGVI